MNLAANNERKGDLGGQGKVLVVEDEVAIAETLRYALESEGFAVFHATSGVDALIMLQLHKPRCVILDVGLPDTSGFDVCREMRKVSSVPILFLSAREDHIDRVVGLELGADDYVTKPFSPREVVARVRALLRRGGVIPALVETPPAIPPVATEIFHIDSQRKQIIFYGTLLDLSRYEYLLLEKLLRTPERVYTREQLMLAIWDEPSASMERTVDAHIKNIRQALRMVRPDLEIIITHRGFGYSLQLPTRDESAV